MTQPNNGWINVEGHYYGMLAAGANVRGIVQAALNDAPAGDVVSMQLPAGVPCTFGGAGLTISKPLTVECGKPTTQAYTNRIEYTGTGAAVTIDSDNVRLVGFDLLGHTAAIGIETGRRNNCTFERLNLMRFRESGIRSRGHGHKYFDSQFQGPAGGHGVGIHALEGWNAVNVERCFFWWGPGYQFTGIDIGEAGGIDSTGIRIVGSRFEGAPLGATCIRLRRGTHGVTLDTIRGEVAGGLVVEQRDGAFGLGIRGGSIVGATSNKTPKLISIAGRGVEIGGGLVLGEALEGIVFEPTADRCAVGMVENLGGTVGALIVNRSGKPGLLAK